MITQEFREWVEDIKEYVKNQLGDLSTVEFEEYEIDKYPLVIRIIVESNGLNTHMAFDQSEYDNNNEEQRCKLVKVRCDDVAWSIGCEIDELKKVTKALRLLGEQK